MENERHSLSSLPMLARLDHLDFIIKNMEKQENNYNPKWREIENGVMTRGRPALDTAVRDAYFKGSLLERVAALENRLFQLCMELESSSTSSTSTGGSGGEPSSQRAKRDSLRTLPTFSNINPFHIPKQHHDTPPPALANNTNDKPDTQRLNTTSRRLRKGKRRSRKRSSPRRRRQRRMLKALANPRRPNPPRNGLTFLY
ncbi:PREDICTED: uncharacterized protein LOC104806705 isoform X1 [Tarenaya hassleriana]|uniref:uncharacterized protein LOC104806705 isoform X1 n=1 Tax=Tarenaya hassleriana TaxID=28532 RepID=UPI00053C750B|nr:PREDICTED: uncharacterized protein LOC104806705 isoform X1 [Tarenaya hassleriana]